MKFSTQVALAALASLVSSTRVDLDKRATPLEVKLAVEENTLVKATVTNSGSTDLKLLKKGTFLDDADVEKLEVYSGSTKVPFEGIRYRIRSTGLSEDAFTSIKAGETIDVTIDMAKVHDLSSGGSFDVVAQGAIALADTDSNNLSGEAVVFKSNTLSVNVDGAKAALVERKYSALNKRTDIQSDCSGSRLTATTNALRNCASLASAAAAAAASGSASKFSEYFKTTSSSTRSVVAARLRAVASECSSTSSGATDTYCSDVYGACESNVLAYTLPSANLIVNCPLYFSYLPALTTTCHAQDQATTTLHEMTHAPGVYSPGTDDYGYGYSAATSLSSSRAVLNADSYALYANAIYVGC